MNPFYDMAKEAFRMPWSGSSSVSNTQRYEQALHRWRTGERESKPHPSEFGLEGLHKSPMHRTPESFVSSIPTTHTLAERAVSSTPSSTVPQKRPEQRVPPGRDGAPKLQPQPGTPKPEQITLLPHQRDAVNFILKNDGEGILAHSTGSGKTITAVKAFDALYDRGKAHKALVITPAGLRTNFLVEGVQRASPHKGSIIAGVSEKGPGVYPWNKPDPESKFHVVSYDIFREHAADIIKATGADTLILDEFHKIKDPNSSVYQSLIKVRPQVRNVIGMTASPVSTHPLNVLQPIHAVTGGMHGLGTKEEFEEQFLQRAPAPFKKRPPIDFTKPMSWMNLIKPRERQTGRKLEFTGWKNTNALQNQLNKHIHFVGAELVKEEMPEKHVETVRVEMSPLQERVYRAALKEIPAPLLRRLENNQPLKEGEQGEVFNRVVKARQAANSVHTLTGLTPQEAAPATPKLQKMLEDVTDHLADTPDGGVIVYSNLIRGGIDIIRAGLESRGLDYGLFIGKGNIGKNGEPVTEESRQQDIKDFRAGKLKIMVVSSAGNEGVSLPNATFHASYDGHWNPERILQAEARGWRVGGQKNRPKEGRKVIVKRYMTVWPESRSLLGKVTAYFQKQKASDAVDEWIYSWADKRHRMNQQLFDLLRGEQPKRHSLFGEGQQRPEAVRYEVPEPVLDPNYKPKTDEALAVDLRGEAQQFKSKRPWWWKWGSQENPPVPRFLKEGSIDTPHTGLLYFLPYKAEDVPPAQPWMKNPGFYTAGVIHGDIAYERDQQTGKLQTYPVNERLPYVMSNAGSLVQSPINADTILRDKDLRLHPTEMLARALTFSLHQGPESGSHGFNSLYRDLQKQPDATPIYYYAPGEKPAEKVASVPHILISGPSGAGKTTLRKRLQEVYPGADYVSLDALGFPALQAVHGSDDPRLWETQTPEQERQVGALIAQRIEELVTGRQRPLILEGITSTDSPAAEGHRLWLDIPPAQATVRMLKRTWNGGSAHPIRDTLGAPRHWLNNRKFYQAAQNAGGYEFHGPEGIVQRVGEILGKSASVEVREGQFGKGLHAAEGLTPGDDLGAAFIRMGNTGNLDQDITRTPLGRYVNHSERPNVVLVPRGDKYHLEVTREVSPGEELLVDYSASDFQEPDPAWKCSSLNSLVGVEGLEPHESPDYARGTSLARPQKDMFRGYSHPPKILDPRDIQYLDDHTQTVRALTPWVNKEPGIKASSVFFAGVQNSLSKCAEEDEDGVLSIVIRCHDLPQKEAREKVLIPRIRMGHPDDQVYSVKRQLRSMFPNLKDPKYDPHVTLMYAHGLQDPANPELLRRVQDVLAQRQLEIELNGLGVFNKPDKGVVYMRANSQDLHDLHQALRGVAQGFGARFTYPEYKPHMTLFNRDQPFTPEEQMAIEQLRVNPMRVRRDRSHMDITVKGPAGFIKIACEQMLRVSGQHLYEDAVKIAREALVLDRTDARALPRTLKFARDLVEGRPVYPKQLAIPPSPIKTSRLILSLHNDASFHQLKKAAYALEEILACLPEATKTAQRLADHAGFVVLVDLRGAYPVLEMQDKVSQLLDEKGFQGAIIKIGAALEEDETPKAKRWVEPKYRRPACQVPNHAEYVKTYVEYSGPQCQSVSSSTRL